MSKRLERFKVVSEMKGFKGNFSDSCRLEFEFYRNLAFSRPCLSQMMMHLSNPELEKVWGEQVWEIGEIWGGLARSIIEQSDDFDDVFSCFDKILCDFFVDKIPGLVFNTKFELVQTELYLNDPVSVDDKRLWKSEIEKKPNTEYLFDIFDQWVELADQKDSDHRNLQNQFNSFGFHLGNILNQKLPDINRVNFFVSPLNDLCNVNELIEVGEKNGGTIWSTNRYCSYGDVVLFYFTKSGGSIFKGLEFNGPSGAFYKNLPGSIFASGRLLTDSMRQQRKGLFYWNSKAFIGDIKIFDSPIQTDEIITSDGISLTRHFRDSRGGIRQPKSLYGHDDYLEAFKKLLFSRNPQLANTYLNFQPYWPDEVPAPDSNDWAEEMGQADVRFFMDNERNRNLNQQHLDNFFQDEEGVRKMFIDPLLSRVIPADARIVSEFVTHPEKSIRVDYCIEKNGRFLPIEAKFDINSDHSFNWNRVFEYLDISHKKKGLLIDINGVFEIDQSDKSKKIIFARAGMNKDSVEILKKWINNYFK